MEPTATPSQSIALMRAHSLASLAQAELEKLILSGALPPGARLGEADTAERIGVSRGPIREAFRALEEQGLVRVEKNRGVFVRQVSLEEADETYAVRAALEGLAARTLARRITKDEVRTLNTILTAMAHACRDNDVARYTELNSRFHNTIVALSGNKKLGEMYGRLVATLTLFRRLTLTRKEALSASLKEHRRIAKAIASGDGEAAARAIEAHAEASRCRTQAALAASQT